jgi:L,D-transpeptidase catalytic domain
VIRLALYPGETQDLGVTRGHIYVFVDEKLTAQFPATAGPAGASRKDRGGHTATETPAGRYLLGRAEHHVSGGWPLSSIPWGANLRQRSDGDWEWSVDGITWRPATGPDGTLTQAGIVFQSRGLGRDLTEMEKADVVEQYRGIFTNTDVNYRQNDFGEWAWNLTQNGRYTPYFLHTTPQDELDTAAGRPVSLTNSHGCVHIRPVDRDLMTRNGWLRRGIPFVVEPYGQVGPIGLT